MKFELHGEMDDRYDEYYKPIYYRCPDRFCGALDCPRCHPENFFGGVYVGDDKNKDE